jgi:hypothetical protein
MREAGTKPRERGTVAKRGTAWHCRHGARGLMNIEGQRETVSVAKIGFGETVLVSGTPGMRLNLSHETGVDLRGRRVAQA